MDSRPLASQTFTPREVNFQDGSKAVFLYDQYGRKISWKNDVSLRQPSYKADEITMILEISQSSFEKMEVTESIEFNPIIQKRKRNPDEEEKEVVDEFLQIPLFNYGCAPQTFSDPFKKDKYDLKGTGTCIDVVELSGQA